MTDSVQPIVSEKRLDTLAELQVITILDSTVPICGGS